MLKYIYVYCLRNFAMEKKVNNDGRILETAYNIIEQVNTLLISAANPSDETSLFIRLSLIKVSLYIFELFCYFNSPCVRIICRYKNFYFLNILDFQFQNREVLLYICYIHYA